MSKPVGKDIGFPKLDELALQIKNGAQAFLKEEYKWLGYFVAGLAITLLVIFSIQPGAADAGQTLDAREARAR